MAPGGRPGARERFRSGDGFADRAHGAAAPSMRSAAPTRAASCTSDPTLALSRAAAGVPWTPGRPYGFILAYAASRRHDPRGRARRSAELALDRSAASIVPMIE
jgi:hypothetical protein